MIDLAAAQRAVYEALREATGAPCFVRLCMDHGALWVSDLPRRTDRLAPALAALETLMAWQGPDSRASMVASVVVGSSETIFYTMTVYLSAAGVRKLPRALSISLISWFAGCLAAAWLC